MSGRGLKLALLLHPAAYRRSHGGELTAVYEDATSGADRWTIAREVLDLAGHGVRLRIGLSSDRLPAQLAARVAPFAAAAVVGDGLAERLSDVIGGAPFGVWDAIVWPRSHGYEAAYHWIDLAGLLLSLLAAVAAVSGRWTAARLAGLVGLLWTLVGAGMEQAHGTLWSLGPLDRLIAQVTIIYGPRTLWVLILLAAPRDLLGPATRARTRSALAGLLFGGVLLNSALGLGPVMWMRYGDGISLALAPVLCATELTLLAIAVPALLRGRHGPAAAALAGSPVAVLTLFLVCAHLWSTTGHSMAVALAGAAVVIAVLLSRRLPAFLDRRPPTAG